MKFSDAFGALSVKDPVACGGVAAVGDGLTDDTTPIQNCLNSAFGTYTSPHSTSNINRSVYFPPGTYLVSKPLLLKSVRSGKIFGTGSHDSTIQFSGTGAVFSSGSITGTTLTATVSSGTVYVGAWLDGGTVESMTLVTASLGGGQWTVDKSQSATGITNAYACVLTINGMAQSEISDLRISNGDVNILYNWDNTGSVNTTANTFRNLGLGNSQYGILVGKNGYQCDNSLYDNVTVGNFTVAGIYLDNANALCHTVIGGGMYGAGGSEVGYWCNAGSFGAIIGAGCTTEDWVAKIGGRLPCHIIGVRSEGPNFVQSEGFVTLTNCVHHYATATDTTFLEVTDPYTCNVIEGCWSSHGKITGNNLQTVHVRNSTFGRRSDYISSFLGRAVIENVQLGKNGSLSSSLGTGAAGIRSVVGHQIIVGGTTIRTLGMEAAALTDYYFAYDTPDLTNFGVTVTLNIADNTVDSGGHGLVAGNQVAFTNNGDTLPTGLTFAKTYYVIATDLTDDNFKLSLTAGGAEIDFTGSQSGTHKIGVVRTYAIGDQVFKTTVAAAGSPGWICTTAGPALANNAGTVAVFKALANVAA